MIGFDYSPCDFCPKDCDGADPNCDTYQKNRQLLRAFAEYDNGLLLDELFDEED